MEHKLYKKDTNLDVEHSRIKVTYEKPAELLGMIDIDMDINTAKEDISDDFEKPQITTNITESDTQNRINNKIQLSRPNLTRNSHRKRHIKRWNHKVESLKTLLEGKLYS